jgi:hypothetical protein
MLYVDGRTTTAWIRTIDLLSDAGQFVGEVKNATRVNLSKQLGDLIEYAQESKKQLGLFINENTRLSKPLLEQLRQGNARIYRFVDRKWKDVTDELYGARSKVWCMVDASHEHLARTALPLGDLIGLVEVTEMSPLTE